MFNEKVDVFSFALCMVELVSQKLPWSGVALGAEVPHRVTTGRLGRRAAQARTWLMQMVHSGRALVAQAQQVPDTPTVPEAIDHHGLLPRLPFDV